MPPKKGEEEEENAPPPISWTENVDQDKVRLPTQIHSALPEEAPQSLLRQLTRVHLSGLLYVLQSDR